MSGTSGDGLDASIINSDAQNSYKVLINKYFKYGKKLSQKIHNLKSKINNLDDIKKLKLEINELEREITIFHSKIVTDILKDEALNPDFIGFHGQTILHSPTDRFSKQLGDGKLLSQLIGKQVIYNFRQNDIKNGGEGAPLTPIFHQIMVKQNKINTPVCILNIGGISNLTLIKDDSNIGIISKDLGPGNCLIDEWIRRNNKGNYDVDGEIAMSGKTNDLILNQALDNFDNRPNKDKLSFDTNDFEINFLRGLSIEDGAATLTDLTANIIVFSLMDFLKKYKNKICKILLCGGGRKNKTLINKIRSLSHENLIYEQIDNYGIDGDFIESQAFAFLAIRSHLNLPISFPLTTGCNSPSSGGVSIKNF